MSDDDDLIGSLRAAAAAGVSGPADPGYAAATPWNRAVDVRPLAVVHARDAADVAATLRWAGAHGRRVAVQRTGHGATDRGEDVVLIDTRALHRIEIDLATRTATLGAGVALAEVIEAAAAHGLLPVAGSAPGVGIAGLLTGGGHGPLARSHGVSSDWVRGFTAVTGDGEIRRVSAQAHPDLFWGLRGGKATLGIVTEVELELIELPRFYGGCAFFAAPDIPGVLRGWQAWSHRLPREATTSVCLLQVPATPDAPPPLAGKLTLAVRLLFAGDADAGAALGAEILALASPVLGGFQTMPGAEIGAVHADPTEPMPVREHGFLLADFPAAAVNELLRTAGPGSGSTLSMVEIRRLDPPPDGPAVADAVCGRDAPYNLLAIRVPMPDPTSGLDHAEAVLEALRPWASGRVMPNFVTSEDPEMHERFWDPPTLARLRELGDRYDPDGVLRVGQVARSAPAALLD